mmetsp:Transcript_43997/g.58365  ORF Transcript_43997/g.58365 Transcript_43997/m.58365 type:complete len:281 (-) Transcript_43997:2481-3323(-)
MRGEVMLLTRNIMITPSEDQNSTHVTHPDPWPCRVLVADFFEPSDLTLRKGEIHWDSVSIHKCSQTDTEHAALKFENAIKGEKVFQHSVIAMSNGTAIQTLESKKITLKNNSIFDAVLFGLLANTTSDIVIENNIVSGVRPELEPKPASLGKWKKPNGGFDLIGASSMTVRNNTASGTWHSGFRVPAKKCDDANPGNVIEDNVAHSISGFGAIVPSGGGECSEFSKFAGYKNSEATLHLNAGKENRAKENISIDSGKGLTIFANNHVEVSNNYIYGSKGM